MIDISNRWTFVFKFYVKSGDKIQRNTGITEAEMIACYVGDFCTPTTGRAVDLRVKNFARKQAVSRKIGNKKERLEANSFPYLDHCIMSSFTKKNFNSQENKLFEKKDWRQAASHIWNTACVRFHWEIFENFYTSELVDL